MTSVRFENVLASFCSPVLLKKKVSNLVSISKKEIPEIGLLVDAYNIKLKKHDIFIDKICECGERILLLVYRNELLMDYLKDIDIRSILDRYGYPESENVSDYLTVLKSRMDIKDFPHEIGVFLGYPVADVIGFIDNKGKNYQFSGYWKVYGDREMAIKTFSIYDRVRNIVSYELKHGRNLDNIIDRFQNINIA